MTRFTVFSWKVLLSRMCCIVVWRIWTFQKNMLPSSSGQKTVLYCFCPEDRSSRLPQIVGTDCMTLHLHGQQCENPNSLFAFNCLLTANPASHRFTNCTCIDCSRWHDWRWNNFDCSCHWWTFEASWPLYIRSEYNLMAFRIQFHNQPLASPISLSLTRNLENSDNLWGHLCGLLILIE